MTCSGVCSIDQLLIIVFYRCQEDGAFCEYDLLRPRLSKPSPPHNGGCDLVPIQPRLQFQPLSPPSNSFLYNAAEGRYFQLFNEELAFDLSGYFSSPFWGRFIPQQCHNEPAIKHATLALSALYKSAILSKSHTVNLDDEHFRFALVQHSQAISSLRKALSDGRPQMTLALVSSLLFSCFESFYGDWETATQQIYGGLNILKHLGENERRQGATDTNAGVEHEVGLTFGRLKLQILSFLAMNPMCEHPFNTQSVVETMLDMPHRFSTLGEAFAAATNLANSVLRHSRTAARCKHDLGSRDVVAQQQQCLQRLVDQWNKAYEPVFLEACRNTSGREYLGVLQLRICVWKCEIMIATSTSDREDVFDRYSQQFRRITHFSRHLLQTDQDIRKSEGPRVQYGMGLVMALFYTATRCREPSVRSEAVTILREWPCTNGVWHSLQAAKVAGWIASLEESRSGDSRFIPEDCRVRMYSLKVVREKNAIAVACMQPSVDGSLEPRQDKLLWL
jgi:hypothetical protein